MPLSALRKLTCYREVCDLLEQIELRVRQMDEEARAAYDADVAAGRANPRQFRALLNAEKDSIAAMRARQGLKIEALLAAIGNIADTD